MGIFEGKVTLVTGAASGIGRALAEEAASRGMRLALCDLQEEALSALAAELRHRGGRAQVGRPADAASHDRRALNGRVGAG